MKTNFPKIGAYAIKSYVAKYTPNIVYKKYKRVEYDKWIFDAVYEHEYIKGERLYFLRYR